MYCITEVKYNCITACNVVSFQGIKDKKLKGILKSYESHYKKAAVQAARAELLLTEEPG